MAEEVKAQAGEKVVKVTDKVKFVAKYPADFPKDKTRYLKDGQVYELHPLHAERLVKKGLGSIQKP